MNDERNQKLSKELFELYRKDVKDFCYKIEKELNNNKINNMDLYLILTTALSNLTLMIMAIDFKVDKKKLKLLYLDSLKQTLLNENIFND